MTFERSLSIEDDLLDEVNQELRATGLNVLRLLVLGTPVDTGRAKGNWFVQLENPLREISQDRRQSTALIEGNLVIASARNRRLPTIIISNNLPYIERLNQGHSQQAPALFVERIIQRVTNG